MLMILTQISFLERYMCFQNSAVYAYMEQSETLSTLKNQSSGVYSVPKLIKFLQGNNWLVLFLLTQMVFFGEIHMFFNSAE
jgi:hypothetical protein